MFVVTTEMGTLRDYCQEYGCERCGLERTMGVVIKKQDK